MRFIEDGPILPDELLNAHDDGQVIFICGAGVSLARAGLPDFRTLTRRVLDDLGAMTDSRARQELESNSTQFDRIFTLLEREFPRQQITRSIAQSLDPGAKPDNRAHRTILRLSKTQSGATRLITTNFDLLFESCNKRVRSRSRLDLPVLDSSDDNWGIVHLHGRVNPAYTDVERDGFVLSSAEFGSAYLVNGWAREFIRETFVRHTTVFVGYSADDPPVRYLLEGLQQGDVRPRPMYAFHTDGDDGARADWFQKGVVPITYDPSHGHAALWSTLEGWSKRAIDSDAWRSRILRLARRGPARLKPHERGMVAHIASSYKGARALRTKSPATPAEWLCVFDPRARFGEPQSAGGFLAPGEIIDPLTRYRLDDDPPRNPKDRRGPGGSPVPEGAWDVFADNDEDRVVSDSYRFAQMRDRFAVSCGSLSRRQYELVGWVSSVADQPATVWWAARQTALHPDFVRDIRRSLSSRPVDDETDAIQQVWSALFHLFEMAKLSDYREHEFASDMKSATWNAEAVFNYQTAFGPRLVVRSGHSTPIPLNRKKSLKFRNLVKLKVEYPSQVRELEVPDGYLKDVVQVYRMNILRALTLRKIAGSLWPPSLCAITPDDHSRATDHSRSIGMSGYVLEFTRLFLQLKEVDLRSAKVEYQSWGTSENVFVRLRIWAGGLDDLVTPEGFAYELLSLSTRAFWDAYHQRDLLLALRQRWRDIDVDLRKKIEARIKKGPPRLRRLSVKENREYRAHLVLARLHWLKKEGCELSLDLTRITEELTSVAPRWRESWADSAAESMDGASGFVEVDTAWSDLARTSISQVIGEATRLSRRSITKFVDHDPFAGLSREKPLKAISALRFEGKQGRYPARFWETFLQPDRRIGDSRRMRTLIAGRLCQLPAEEFASIARETSRWLKAVGGALRQENPTAYDRLWVHFIRALSSIQEAGASALVRSNEEVDWPTEAINSASGNLAELLMSDPRTRDRKAGQGFPDGWLVYADQLLRLPDDSRRYVLVIFAHSLGWFYHVEPGWAQTTFLDVLTSADADYQDKDAIWGGFFWWPRAVPNPLLIELKPLLLGMARERGSSVRRQTEALAGTIFVGWLRKDNSSERLISDDEMREILVQADDEFRERVVLHLRSFKPEEDPHAIDELIYFLRNVWPKQNSVRTPRVMASLCEVAFEQTTHFPDVAKAVSQIVSKTDAQHIYIPALRHGEDGAFIDFPEETLELLYAVLPDDPSRWPYSAADALQLLGDRHPEIKRDSRYIELTGRQDKP